MSVGASNAERSGHEMRGRESEMRQAVSACEFPLAVWDLLTEILYLANDAAADLAGVPVEGLIGRRVDDVLAPKAAFEATVAVMRAGAVEDVRVHRQVVRTDGETVAVTIWTRTADLDSQKCGISLLIADAERERFGRDPGQPWRDIGYAAVGVADASWRILRVSADVTQILGGSPGDWVGRSIPPLIDPADAERLPAPRMLGTTGPATAHNIRVRDHDGGWVHVCVLAAPTGSDDPPDVAFAIVAQRPSTPADRVAELELRLRQIAAEVRAAGVLENIGDLPAVTDFPQLGKLTTRQWEILSRLLRGERVPTIAADLFLSQSTVRNHLSAIFERFVVHSQPELLSLLRRDSEHPS